LYCAIYEGCTPEGSVHAEGSINVPAAADNDYGTALVPASNMLVCFKNNATYALLGSSESDFEVVPLFPEVGCWARRSPVIIGSNLYWLSHDAVWSYDMGGGSIQRISDDIQSDIRGLATGTTLAKAAGGKWYDYYLLSVPESGQSSNSTTYVYNTTTKKWSNAIPELKASCYIPFENPNDAQQLYWGSSQDSTVYLYNNTYQDAGTDYICTFESGYSDFGYPRRRKEIKKIYVDAEGGSGDLQISLYGRGDHENKDTSIIVPLSHGGSFILDTSRLDIDRLGEVASKTYTDYPSIGFYGDYIKYKIQYSNSAAVKIFSITFQYELLPLE
jgi:hypothetical protein